jgi:hypothetical protein
MQTTERISDEHCMLHLSRYHAYQWIVLERFWRLSLPAAAIGKQCLKIRREGKIRTKAILSVFEKIGEI